MRYLVPTLVLLGLGHCVLALEVPDPDLCFVDPWDEFLGAVFVPFPEGSSPPELAQVAVRITRGAHEPWPDAYVEIVFLDEDSLHFCRSTLLSGSTDADGFVYFALPVGGCVHDSESVLVRAQGETIRSYSHAKSPDVDGSGHVDLADFIALGSMYGAGIPGCTDFDNDGNTGLSDFITFGDVLGLGCEE